MANAVAAVAAIALVAAGCAPASESAGARRVRDGVTTSLSPSALASHTPTPGATSTAGGAPAGSGSGGGTASTTAAAPAANSAAKLLATLAVKGRAPKTGYSRDQFGPDWPDVDHNGCSTRNDILRRDLVDITYRDGGDCIVATGTLRDPYTGKAIHFVRGVGTSTAVQIDHVVALSDAWQKGAQRWSASKREAFANDPAELLAVDGPTNESKGDGDAATWLPPNKAYRCTYVAKQIQVKAKYGLWVTAAEHDAMARVLTSCGGGQIAAVAPPPATTTAPAMPPARGTVYFKNCSAVRAAGKAPLHRGDPGYRSGLDRDDDGLACE